MTSLGAVAQWRAPKIKRIAIPMSMILQDRLMMCWWCCYWKDRAEMLWSHDVALLDELGSWRVLMILMHPIFQTSTWGRLNKLLNGNHYRSYAPIYGGYVHGCSRCHTALKSKAEKIHLWGLSIHPSIKPLGSWLWIAPGLVAVVRRIRELDGSTDPVLRQCKHRLPLQRRVGGWVRELWL